MRLYEAKQAHALLAELTDPLESDLFRGIDLDGAVLVAQERVAQTIDAAVSRALADMRAGWGRAA